MGKLDSKVAWVTGGGRGIGRAIALALAAEGARIAITARTSSQLESVAMEIDAMGATCLPIVADAMSYEETKSACKQIIEELESIDILVNNVGGIVRGEGRIGRESSTAEQDQVFIDNLVLNLASAHRTLVEVAPHMIERGEGRVINIGSGYSKRSGGPAGYTAAKHGTIGLTRATAVEMAKHGITVNCVCPGWTNTLDWEKLGRIRGTNAKEAKAFVAKDNLQNRVLEPEELGPILVLLASSESAGITGQVISVDGGYKV